MRWFFCLRCIFSMMISVINFSSKSRIWCFSLGMSGGLVLNVTGLKNLFLLLTTVFIDFIFKRDFFLNTPTVLEVLLLLGVIN